MQIDVTQELIGYDGEVIKDAKGALTLRRVCALALTVQGQDDKLDPEEKMKRFLLAQKIYGSEVVPLTVDEISKMKKLIGEGFGPAAMGPAWLLLDPPDKPEELKNKLP